LPSPGNPLAGQGEGWEGSIPNPQLVYLGIGSNQGDRLALLRTAIAHLAPAIHLQRSSSLYESPPWGYLPQPPFLNAVLETTTALEPFALLQTLKAIEQALGRTSGPRYGPRPIDIDILIFDQLHLTHPSLTIPHLRIAERSFVLVPLAELAPNLQLDPAGPTISALRDQRSDRDQVRLVQQQWI